MGNSARLIGGRRGGKLAALEPAPLAVSFAPLLADLAKVVTAYRLVCGDLETISRHPALTPAARLELDDVAADLGVLLLMQRELAGRIDAWVATQDAAVAEGAGVTDQVTTGSDITA